MSREVKPGHDAASFKAGLVGAGYISEYHAAAIRRAGNAELIGVFDLDASRAAELASRFGVKAFASLAELRAAGAEVLHILTPPHTHAAVTLEALDLGCHVLVEKPLATDPKDCEAIERKAAETGLKVCVNHSLLYDPQIRRAIETVRRGELGRIVGVDLLRSSAYPPYPGGPLPPQYRSAGYPFRDLGVHALYLMEAFLGPIEDVQAAWSSLGGDPNLAFDTWRALLRCKNGLGQFQLCWNVKPLQSQLIIHGTRGVMRVDLFLMFQARRKALPVPKAAERVINAMTDSLRPLVDVPKGIVGYLRKKVLPYHGLQDLVREFYDGLAKDTAVPVSVSDAARVVKWTEHVARAADAEHEQRLAAFTLSEHVPVLVTGASGALGSAIVDRLRSQGTRVRVMMRRPPEPVPAGVEVALGDLGDPIAVNRAVRGAEVVIHAGAAMKGGWIEHQCATVTGTQNVLDACRAHGVKKLVHISSMSVVDWAGAPPGTPINESSAFEPRPEDRGSYTRAKLEAEKLVAQCWKEHRLPCVILRPGQIFGGRIPLLTPAVARRRGKRWIVLGDGRVRLPLIHMDDVVEATLKAVQCEMRDAQVIQLVGPDAPNQNDVLARVVGPTARVRRVPRWLLFMMGRTSELMLKPGGRKSPLSTYRLRSALSKRTFGSNNSHLIRGWQPRPWTVFCDQRETSRPQIEPSKCGPPSHDRAPVPLAVL